MFECLNVWNVDLIKMFAEMLVRLNVSNVEWLKICYRVACDAECFKCSLTENMLQKCLWSWLLLNVLQQCLKCWLWHSWHLQHCDWPDRLTDQPTISRSVNLSICQSVDLSICRSVNGDFPRKCILGPPPPPQFCPKLPSHQKCAKP